MAVKKLVVLGVTLTIGICLIIGGCISDNNWNPMYLVIPGALSGLSLYGYYSTQDGDEGWVSSDGWIFLLAAFITTLLCLPVVLFHGSIIKLTNMWLSIAGSVVMIIGYIIFDHMDGESTSLTPF